MNNTVIEVEGLRKEYRRLRGGRTLAVDGLDMHVPEGGVFGFLGPNGAGKTTTIRCLLGLVRPTAGRCTLLSAEVHAALASVIGRVGAIVETPALYPRLGIAAALLKDPELLILDEPANGLDPAGIKEVRDLVRRLGREGRTVFVSSHQLAEVQQMCDRVAILSRGRLVATGRVAEVLSRGRREVLIVKLRELEEGLGALRSAGLEASMEDGMLRVHLPPSDGARVTEILASRGMFVSELRPEEVSLEDVFLELTQGPSPGQDHVAG